MRLSIGCRIGMLVFLLGLGAPAAARDFIAVVKSVEGGAVVRRDQETIPVANGMALKKGDIVKSDASSTVGIVFADDTRVTMGPGTEIVVDDYLFEPLEEELAFVLRMVRGTVSFLSGQISKLSPESVKLVLPAATIGVRGTHVLIKAD